MPSNLGRLAFVMGLCLTLLYRMVASGQLDVDQQALMENETLIAAPSFGSGANLNNAESASASTSTASPPPQTTIRNNPSTTENRNRFVGFQGNDETQLIEYLMTNYRGYGLARPVADLTKAMDVYLRLIVEEFSELDEQLGVVRIVATVSAIWRDEFLRWNSSAFSGIEAIVLRDQQIFMPIIMPVGSGSHKAPIFHQTAAMAASSLIWTDNTGLVHASVTEKFESSCKIDLTDFPVDTQHCQFCFKVLRFRHPHMKLRLLQKSANSSTLVTSAPVNSKKSDGDDVSGETDDDDDGISLQDASKRTSNQMWDVLDLYGEETTVNSSSGLTFSAVVYTLVIQRKADYYLWNILLPTASMAAVQTSVFFLPFSPERVMFSITAVLAVDIFQSSLTAKIHAASEPVPLVKYSTAQLMMGIVITIESIMVLGIAEHSEPLPRWIVNVMDRIFGRIEVDETQKGRERFNNRRQRRHSTWFNSMFSPSRKGSNRSSRSNSDYNNKLESPSHKAQNGPQPPHSNTGGLLEVPLQYHHAVASDSTADGVFQPVGDRGVSFTSINNDDIAAKKANLVDNEIIIRSNSVRMSDFKAPSIFISADDERHRLALVVDRFFLGLIILFFSGLPVIFFKVAA